MQSTPSSVAGRPRRAVAALMLGRTWTLVWPLGATASVLTTARHAWFGGVPRTEVAGSSGTGKGEQSWGQGVDGDRVH